MERGAQRWLRRDPPFTLDSLKALYDPLSDSLFGYPFHPDSFKVPRIEEALFELVLDERDPSRLDSNYYYFGPYEANVMVDDAALVQAAASGLGVIK